MQRLFGAFWMAYVCAAIFCHSTPQAAPAAAPHRPKIALVLSGGGAKGAAHLGVLKVLEEMRIPVDMVLGTSMGSYVAGMYALGYSADEVTTKTLQMDWNKGYKDKVTRQDLSLRKKKENYYLQIMGYRGMQFFTYRI